jgi:hypothetical protein
MIVKKETTAVTSKGEEITLTEGTEVNLVHRGFEIAIVNLENGIQVLIKDCRTIGLNFNKRYKYKV